MTTTWQMSNQARSMTNQPSPKAMQLGPPVLVDAHVHCHGFVKWENCLSAARHNFKSTVQRAELPETTIGCLMLTESQGVCRFDELRAGAGVSSWQVQLTDEPCSVICRRDDCTIMVVEGRQIVTRERLEVLALACAHRFVDGQPIVGIIEQVTAAGGLAVLPWGFGKWRMRRGRMVKRLMRTLSPDAFAFGDNGGRALWSLRPRLFSRAESAGFAVWPGSDPLPFQSEVQRVGSYGSVIECQLDQRVPAAGVLQAMRARRASACEYGQRVSLARFLRMQMLMQIRKGRAGR